jgi:hypothetical protein
VGGISGDEIRLLTGGDKLIEPKEKSNNQAHEPQEHHHQVRLPGFLIEEEIGLGDAIKRITYGLGMKTCAGCEQRAAMLNRWLRLSR